MGQKCRRFSAGSGAEHHPMSAGKQGGQGAQYGPWTGSQQTGVLGHLVWSPDWDPGNWWVRARRMVPELGSNRLWVRAPTNIPRLGSSALACWGTQYCPHPVDWGLFNHQHLSVDRPPPIPGQTCKDS